eukprot:gene2475-3215_t
MACKSANLLLRRASLADAAGNSTQQIQHLKNFETLVAETIPGFPAYEKRKNDKDIVLLEQKMAEVRRIIRGDPPPKAHAAESTGRAPSGERSGGRAVSGATAARSHTRQPSGDYRVGQESPPIREKAPSRGPSAAEPLESSSPQSSAAQGRASTNRSEFSFIRSRFAPHVGPPVKGRSPEHAAASSSDDDSERIQRWTVRRRSRMGGEAQPQEQSSPATGAGSGVQSARRELGESAGMPSGDHSKDDGRATLRLRERQQRRISRLGKPSSGSGSGAGGPVGREEATLTSETRSAGDETSEMQSSPAVGTTDDSDSGAARDPPFSVVRSPSEAAGLVDELVDDDYQEAELMDDLVDDDIHSDEDEGLPPTPQRAAPHDLPPPRLVPRRISCINIESTSDQQLYESPPARPSAERTGRSSTSQTKEEGTGALPPPLALVHLGRSVPAVAEHWRPNVVKVHHNSPKQMQQRMQRTSAPEFMPMEHKIQQLRLATAERRGCEPSRQAPMEELEDGEPTDKLSELERQINEMRAAFSRIGFEEVAMPSPQRVQQPPTPARNAQAHSGDDADSHGTPSEMPSDAMTTHELERKMLNLYRQLTANDGRARGIGGDEEAVVQAVQSLRVDAEGQRLRVMAGLPNQEFQKASLGSMASMGSEKDPLVAALQDLPGAPPALTAGPLARHVTIKLLRGDGRVNWGVQSEQARDALAAKHIAETRPSTPPADEADWDMASPLSSLSSHSHSPAGLLFRADDTSPAGESLALRSRSAYTEAAAAAEEELRVAQLERFATAMASPHRPSPGVMTAGAWQQSPEAVAAARMEHRRGAEDETAAAVAHETQLVMSSSLGQCGADDAGGSPLHELALTVAAAGPGLLEMAEGGGLQLGVIEYDAGAASGLMHNLGSWSETDSEEAYDDMVAREIDRLHSLKDVATSATDTVNERSNHPAAAAYPSPLTLSHMLPPATPSSAPASAAGSQTSLSVRWPVSRQRRSRADPIEPSAHATRKQGDRDSGDHSASPSGAGNPDPPSAASDADPMDFYFGASSHVERSPVGLGGGSQSLGLLPEGMHRARAPSPPPSGLSPAEPVPHASSAAPASSSARGTRPPAPSPWQLPHHTTSPVLTPSLGGSSTQAIALPSSASTSTPGPASASSTALLGRLRMSTWRGGADALGVDPARKAEEFMGDEGGPVGITSLEATSAGLVAAKQAAAETGARGGGVTRGGGAGEPSEKLSCPLDDPSRGAGLASQERSDSPQAQARAAAAFAYMEAVQAEMSQSASPRGTSVAHQARGHPARGGHSPSPSMPPKRKPASQPCTETTPGASQATPGGSSAPPVARATGSVPDPNPSAGVARGSKDAPLAGNGKQGIPPPSGLTGASKTPGTAPPRGVLAAMRSANPNYTPGDPGSTFVGQLFGAELQMQRGGASPGHPPLESRNQLGDDRYSLVPEPSPLNLAPAWGGSAIYSSVEQGEEQGGVRIESAPHSPGSTIAGMACDSLLNNIPPGPPGIPHSSEASKEKEEGGARLEGGVEELSVEGVFGREALGVVFREGPRLDAGGLPALCDRGAGGSDTGEDEVVDGQPVGGTELQGNPETKRGRESVLALGTSGSGGGVEGEGFGGVASSVGAVATELDGETWCSETETATVGAAAKLQSAGEACVVADEGAATPRPPQDEAGPVGLQLPEVQEFVVAPFEMAQSTLKALEALQDPSMDLSFERLEPLAPFVEDPVMGWGELPELPEPHFSRRENTSGGEAREELPRVDTPCEEPGGAMGVIPPAVELVSADVPGQSPITMRGAVSPGWEVEGSADGVSGSGTDADMTVAGTRIEDDARQDGGGPMGAGGDAAPFSYRARETAVEEGAAEGEKSEEERTNREEDSGSQEGGKADGGDDKQQSVHARSSERAASGGEEDATEERVTREQSLGDLGEDGDGKVAEEWIQEDGERLGCVERDAAEGWCGEGAVEEVLRFYDGDAVGNVTAERYDDPSEAKPFSSRLTADDEDTAGLRTSCEGMDALTDFDDYDDDKFELESRREGSQPREEEVAAMAGVNLVGDGPTQEWGRDLGAAEEVEAVEEARWEAECPGESEAWCNDVTGAEGSADSSEAFAYQNEEDEVEDEIETEVEKEEDEDAPCPQQPGQLGVGDEGMEHSEGGLALPDVSALAHSPDLGMLSGIAGGGGGPAEQPGRREEARDIDGVGARTAAAYGDSAYALVDLKLAQIAAACGASQRGGGLEQRERLGQHVGQEVGSQHVSRVYLEEQEQEGGASRVDLGGVAADHALESPEGIGYKGALGRDAVEITASALDAAGGRGWDGGSFDASGSEVSSQESAGDEEEEGGSQSSALRGGQPPALLAGRLPRESDAEAAGEDPSDWPAHGALTDAEWRTEGADMSASKISPDADSPGCSELSDEEAATESEGGEGGDSQEELRMRELHASPVDAAGALSATQHAEAGADGTPFDVGAEKDTEEEEASGGAGTNVRREGYRSAMQFEEEEAEEEEEEEDAALRFTAAELLGAQDAIVGLGAEDSTALGGEEEEDGEEENVDFELKTDEDVARVVETSQLAVEGCAPLEEDAEEEEEYARSELGALGLIRVEDANPGLRAEEPSLFSEVEKVVEDVASQPEALGGAEAEGEVSGPGAECRLPFPNEAEAEEDVSTDAACEWEAAGRAGTEDVSSGADAKYHTSFTSDDEDAHEAEADDEAAGREMAGAEDVTSGLDAECCSPSEEEEEEEADDSASELEAAGRAVAEDTTPRLDAEYRLSEDEEEQEEAEEEEQMEEVEVADDLTSELETEGQAVAEDVTPRLDAEYRLSEDEEEQEEAEEEEQMEEVVVEVVEDEPDDLTCELETAGWAVAEDAASRDSEYSLEFEEEEEEEADNLTSELEAVGRAVAENVTPRLDAEYRPPLEKEEEEEADDLTSELEAAGWAVAEDVTPPLDAEYRPPFEEEEEEEEEEEAANLTSELEAPGWAVAEDVTPRLDAEYRPPLEKEEEEEEEEEEADDSASELEAAGRAVAEDVTSPLDAEYRPPFEEEEEEEEEADNLTSELEAAGRAVAEDVTPRLDAEYRLSEDEEEQEEADDLTSEVEAAGRAVAEDATSRIDAKFHTLFPEDKEEEEEEEADDVACKWEAAGQAVTEGTTFSLDAEYRLPFEDDEEEADDLTSELQAERRVVTQEITSGLGDEHCLPFLEMEEGLEMASHREGVTLRGTTGAAARLGAAERLPSISDEVLVGETKDGADDADEGVASEWNAARLTATEDARILERAPFDDVEGEEPEDMASDFEAAGLAGSPGETSAVDAAKCPPLNEEEEEEEEEDTASELEAEGLAVMEDAPSGPGAGNRMSFDDDDAADDDAAEVLDEMDEEENTIAMNTGLELIQVESYELDGDSCLPVDNADALEEEVEGAAELDAAGLAMSQGRASRSEGCRRFQEAEVAEQHHHQQQEEEEMEWYVTQSGAECSGEKQAATEELSGAEARATGIAVSEGGSSFELHGVEHLALEVVVGSAPEPQELMTPERAGGQASEWIGIGPGTGVGQGDSESEEEMLIAADDEHTVQFEPEADEGCRIRGGDQVSEPADGCTASSEGGFLGTHSASANDEPEFEVRPSERHLAASGPSAWELAELRMQELMAGINQTEGTERAPSAPTSPKAAHGAPLEQALPALLPSATEECRSEDSLHGGAPAPTGPSEGSKPTLKDDEPAPGSHEETTSDGLEEQPRAPPAHGGMVQSADPSRCQPESAPSDAAKQAPALLGVSRQRASPEAVEKLAAEATAPTPRELLGRVSIFAGAPSELLDGLHALGTWHKFGTGELIVAARERLDRLFLVVEGGVTLEEADGEMAGCLAPGDSFGVGPLVRGEPHPLAAFATAPSVLLGVARVVLNAALTAHAGARDAIVAATEEICPQQEEAGGCEGSRQSEEGGPVPEDAQEATPEAEQPRQGSQPSEVAPQEVTEGAPLQHPPIAPPQVSADMPPATRLPGGADGQMATEPPRTELERLQASRRASLAHLAPEPPREATALPALPSAPRVEAPGIDVETAAAMGGAPSASGPGVSVAERGKDSGMPTALAPQPTAPPPRGAGTSLYPPPTAALLMLSRTHNLPAALPSITPAHAATGGVHEAAAPAGASPVPPGEEGPPVGTPPVPPGEEGPPVGTPPVPPGEEGPPAGAPPVPPGGEGPPTWDRAAGSRYKEQRQADANALSERMKEQLQVVQALVAEEEQRRQCSGPEDPAMREAERKTWESTLEKEVSQLKRTARLMEAMSAKNPGKAKTGDAVDIQADSEEQLTENLHTEAASASGVGPAALPAGMAARREGVSDLQRMQAARLASLAHSLEPPTVRLKPELDPKMLEFFPTPTEQREIGAVGGPTWRSDVGTAAPMEPELVEQGGQAPGRVGQELERMQAQRHASLAHLAEPGTTGAANLQVPQAEQRRSFGPGSATTPAASARRDEGGPERATEGGADLEADAEVGLEAPSPGAALAKHLKHLQSARRAASSISCLADPREPLPRLEAAAADVVEAATSTRVAPALLTQELESLQAERRAGLAHLARPRREGDGREEGWDWEADEMAAGAARWRADEGHEAVRHRMGREPIPPAQELESLLPGTPEALAEHLERLHDARRAGLVHLNGAPPHRGEAGLEHADTSEQLERLQEARRAATRISHLAHPEGPVVVQDPGRAYSQMGPSQDLGHTDGASPAGVPSAQARDSAQAAQCAELLQELYGEDASRMARRPESMQPAELCVPGVASSRHAASAAEHLEEAQAARRAGLFPDLYGEDANRMVPPAGAVQPGELREPEASRGYHHDSVAAQVEEAQAARRAGLFPDLYGEDPHMIALPAGSIQLGELREAGTAGARPNEDAAAQLEEAQLARQAGFFPHFRSFPPEALEGESALGQEDEDHRSRLHAVPSVDQSDRPRQPEGNRDQEHADAAGPSGRRGFRAGQLAEVMQYLQAAALPEALPCTRHAPAPAPDHGPETFRPGPADEGWAAAEQGVPPERRQGWLTRKLEHLTEARDRSAPTGAREVASTPPLLQDQRRSEALEAAEEAWATEDRVALAGSRGSREHLEEGGAWPANQGVQESLGPYELGSDEIRSNEARWQHELARSVRVREGLGAADGGGSGEHLEEAQAARRAGLFPDLYGEDANRMAPPAGAVQPGELREPEASRGYHRDSVAAQVEEAQAARRAGLFPDLYGEGPHMTALPAGSIQLGELREAGTAGARPNAGVALGWTRMEIEQPERAQASWEGMGPAANVEPMEQAVTNAEWAELARMEHEQGRRLRQLQQEREHLEVVRAAAAAAAVREDSQLAEGGGPADQGLGGARGGEGEERAPMWKGAELEQAHRSNHEEARRGELRHEEQMRIRVPVITPEHRAELARAKALEWERQAEDARRAQGEHTWQPHPAGSRQLPETLQELAGGRGYAVTQQHLWQEREHELQAELAEMMAQERGPRREAAEPAALGPQAADARAMWQQTEHVRTMREEMEHARRDAQQVAFEEQQRCAEQDRAWTAANGQEEDGMPLGVQQADIAYLDPVRGHQHPAMAQQQDGDSGKDRLSRMELTPNERAL